MRKLEKWWGATKAMGEILMVSLDRDGSQRFGSGLASSALSVAQQWRGFLFTVRL